MGNFGHIIFGSNFVLLVSDDQLKILIMVIHNHICRHLVILRGIEVAVDLIEVVVDLVAVAVGLLPVIMYLIEMAMEIIVVVVDLVAVLMLVVLIMEGATATMRGAVGGITQLSCTWYPCMLI